LGFMNFISAIKQFATPEAQGLSMPQAGLNPAAPSIPAADLRELPPVISSISAPGSADGSFGNMLGRLVGEVSDKQATASAAMEGLLKGDNVSLHQAMISMEEAS